MSTERIDVPVAGGALAVHRLGDTAAPPVVAIHGITSTSRTWLAVAAALAGRASLLAVDLRGRGDSAALPAPFGIDAHVADVIAVLDHFGLARAVVAGHSLGAYIAARLAVRHPERVTSLVLVDGGLTIPESEGADPEQFIRAFLGPTLERLQIVFDDRESYRAWWRAHPAVAPADIDGANLDAYADHDAGGEPRAVRSRINPQVVRDDGVDLFDATDADALAVPAVFLYAPRGMVDDPHPMQPAALVQAWAAADPERRRALEVPDTNHYSIAWGRHGAAMVADAIARAVSETDASTRRPAG